ncbi:MAG TPA: glycosyltransferase [Solirubrobacteraceae bacterium]|nr:glycosyltransferase [Solirubrobacteraceae bacterium]
MSSIKLIPVTAMDPLRFGAVLADAAFADLKALIANSARTLHGRVIWNVSSTAKGGGVAELLLGLLGYSRGAGVDARWAVIGGDRDFFATTKRLHNRLHGFDGDGGPLAEHDREIYERTLAAPTAELAGMVGPRDVVILHDPQTAGLAGPMRAIGATVIWRCHVGVDQPNAHVREAWDFLRPYVTAADACVFSRPDFVWSGLDPARVSVIHPSIDAFSPKNAEQSHGQQTAILARAGLVPRARTGHPVFTRADGTPGRIDRMARMLESRPLRASDRYVTQISRWDRLKDPIGVVRGFVDHVAPHTAAHLVLAGPDADAVADDPEGAAMYAAVRDCWWGLPEAQRDRVHLALLPMTDIEENAAIVNALQRRATVVVQKSLAEGFGLTVAEAMWKRRPVVASRVGGIQDQIVDGESGVLIPDPLDLRAFGDAVTGLLSDPPRARRIGVAARARVTEGFLGPDHLAGYFALIDHLLAARARHAETDSRPAQAPNPGAVLRGSPARPPLIPLHVFAPSLMAGEAPAHTVGDT